jgi:hypothetical protein
MGKFDHEMGILLFSNPAKRKLEPQFLPHLNATRTFFAVMQANLYWEYIGRSA